MLLCNQYVVTVNHVGFNLILQNRVGKKKKLLLVCVCEAS